MALKFVEGFDYYAVASEIGDGRKWTDSVGITTYGSLVAGRTAGLALRLSPGNYYSDMKLQKLLGANFASGVAGFAFRVSAFPTSYNRYSNFGPIQFKATERYGHIDIRLNTSGQLVVARCPLDVAAATINYVELATSARNLIKNVWHYIEVKILIHESAGYVIVKVDGDEWINFTGDTQYDSSYAYFNSIQLKNIQLSGSGTYDFDDFYFCDLTGTKNNDFLGDCRVCTLYPDADTADADFTPDTGADGYARINSETIDDTSYVESDTVGHKSLFTYGALPATDIGDVAGVQVVTRAVKTEEAPRHIKNVVLSASSESVLSAYSIVDQFTNNPDLLEDDPAGGAWDAAAVNALHAGFEITA
jgi:hypothetical protein